MGTWIIFLIALGWLCVCLLAFWPGNISLDAINYVQKFFEEPGGLKHIGGSESFYYELLAALCVQFDERLLAMSLLQIFIAAGLIARFHYLTSERMEQPRVAILFSLLMIFGAESALNILSIERDMLLAWIGAAITLQLIEISLNKTSEITTRQIAVLLATALTATVFKREGIVYFLSLPIQLYFLKMVSWQKAFRIAGAGLAGLAILLVFAAAYSKEGLIHNKNPYDKNRYLKSTLPYVLEHRGHPLNTEEKLLVSIDEKTDLEEEAYRSFALRQILLHPWLWLKSSVKRSADITYNFYWNPLRDVFPLNAKRMNLSESLFQRLKPQTKLPELKRNLDLFRRFLGATFLKEAALGPNLGLAFLLIVALAIPIARKTAILLIPVAWQAIGTFIFMTDARPRYFYFATVISIPLIAYLIYELRLILAEKYWWVGKEAK